MAVAASMTLAACSTGPGTGWSRAPDLSIYAALGTFGQLAREQAMLCGGVAPNMVASRWVADFGLRQAAVRAELVARHGANAIEAAEAERPPRADCPDVPDGAWRLRYIELLRLLEARMGLA